MILKYIIPILAIFILTSCIRYSEIWKFNKNGGGSVQIICEPANNWMQYADATNWFEAALLFLPPYKSLSQDFARAGAKIQYCKFKTKNGKPKVNISISFDSISQIAKTSLFADRSFQWRKSKYFVTMLQNINAGKPLEKIKLLAIKPDAFKNAEFNLLIYLPGKITKITGAKKEGNCAFINTNIKNLLTANPIVISAEARIAYPLWLKFLFFIFALIIVTAAFIITRKFFIQLT